MAIHQWPEQDRPREKLLMHGAQALSDTELLAIFLRTGCVGKSAVDLARDLVHNFKGLRAMLEASQKEFCSHKGLGQATYAQLQAVLEISKRHMAEQLQQSPKINSCAAVKKYLIAQLRSKKTEVFAALFLDTQHQLIQFEILFTGTINSAAIYPREVVKRSLKHNASAVIFAHNHPSGHSKPSQADIAITERLKKALLLLDIKTLDHIIVADNNTYSFAEHGII
ncbi:MAG: hypothetical protein COA42_01540 [Alteromonadaceae bacterium]|nr:MAG: hypothetical protein COA42_01540 [Alteromonadaceae bacterium]